MRTHRNFYARLNKRKYTIEPNMIRKCIAQNERYRDEVGGRFFNFRAKEIAATDEQNASSKKETL